MEEKWLWGFVVGSRKHQFFRQSRVTKGQSPQPQESNSFQEEEFDCCIKMFSLLRCQIYHNIKYSSDMHWNHVGICMLNSGAIRTAIDERYKNGTAKFFLQNYTASSQRPLYNVMAFVLTFRFHYYGGDPHRFTIWRNF